MFCTGCGSPINSSELYCHHCGKQLSTTGSGHPPYRQRTAPWVYVTGFALLLLMFYMTWSGAQYGDLEKPAKEQLESIKEGNIPQAYYEYTSKQFQAATSLEQFRQFLKDHEIVAKFTDFSFGEPIFDDKRGVLTGSLESQAGEKVEIKYFLYRQDDEWKIDSFQIIDDAHPQPPTDSSKIDPKDKEAMLSPIETQLQDLKRGDVDDAYVDVSEGFKKATTLPQFKEFVKQYQIFGQYKNFNVLEQLTQGDRAAVKLELTDDTSKIPIEYYLIKENDKWKIWSLQVLMPAENMPATSLMVEPVQGQLSALKDNEIDKAYDDFTSDEFKKITPKETFKNFMVNFPLFTQYEVVDYKQPRIEETGGKLLVVLKGKDDKTATVEYTLGVSDGKWKIWGLRLVDFDAKEAQQTKNVSQEDSENTKALETLAKDQLKAISAKDMKKAYDEYTSPQFREVTKFDVFTRFMTAYPIFSDYKNLTFGKMTVENNIASLKGTFEDAEHHNFNVEYDFIKQGDQWKIQRIQLLADEGQKPKSDSYYGDIKLGNEIDSKGNITNPMTDFKDANKVIYANIFVNGSKGDVLTITFRHNDTNSAIKPISSTPLTKDGDFRTSFSFTPPPKGWPKGDYQLEITSSNGQQKIYPFKVE